ncbi:hypothetical protein ROLI_024160 [Roseobacter fucihabitans]|uniref:Uncharacterized protein n=1 Tax=Roseobacter fucihabitans TaxID=1537242 RepID=A0ABZ2BTH3_9RHOB|nr:hypothetical protein [Roseobacter litoralis]MBC6965278.1 hypothetical protein [Roseobacter litoralis]
MMAFAFVFVGGISGFIAAVATLLTGHGLWQALLNYWWAAAAAFICLAAVFSLVTLARIVNRKFLHTIGLNADSGS